LCCKTAGDEFATVFEAPLRKFSKSAKVSVNLLEIAETVDSTFALI